MNKVLLLLSSMILLFGTPTFAAVVLSGELSQGGFLRGQVPVGTRVFFQDQALRLSADGQFIIGFGRDAAVQQDLTLISADGQSRVETLQLRRRHYDIQRIDGISAKMMSPGAAELQRIDAEARLAAAARQRDSELPFFLQPFSWPLKGRISGVYGSQRILNGEPRRPHYGVDIAAPKGTPVLAPAGGRVSLKHEGMFFSGATLIVDHGHGLSSSFLHLSEILVQEGELVKKGQPIARVGASGRVTGPHLDWRVNWFDQRLDPQLLVGTDL
jgi:murein DD-endopeptidase MepM/ murein hydrolase activator NlpD